jgi:hypothetical protein
MRSNMQLLHLEDHKRCYSSRYMARLDLEAQLDT